MRAEERTVGVGHFGGGSRQSGCSQVLLAHLFLLPGEATQHVGEVDRILHQLLTLLLLWTVNIQG